MSYTLLTEISFYEIDHKEIHRVMDMLRNYDKMYQKAYHGIEVRVVEENNTIELWGYNP